MVMKILIMTDIEGCAGFLDFENWDNPAGRYYDKTTPLWCADCRIEVEDK